MALYKIVSIKMLQNWQIDQTNKKPFAQQTPYTPLCEACEQKNRCDAPFMRYAMHRIYFFFFLCSTDRRAWRPQIVLLETFHPIFLLAIS